MKTKIVDGELVSVTDVSRMANKEGLAKGIFIKTPLGNTTDLRKVEISLKGAPPTKKYLKNGSIKLILHKGVQATLKPEFTKGLEKQEAMSEFRVRAMYHTELSGDKLLFK